MLQGWDRLIQPCQVFPMGALGNFQDFKKGMMH